jgi:WD40 repeat protein
MANAKISGLRLKRAFDLTFSADGKRAATVARDVVLWDIDARKRVLSSHPFAHPGHLDFSPGGATLAVKSTSGRIAVLDTASGETLTDCRNQREGEGTQVYFSSDGNLLVDASWKGELRARNPSTGAIVFQEAAGGMVFHLDASADRTVFAYTVSQLPPSDTEPPPESPVVMRRWPFTSHPPRVLPLARRFIRALSLAPSGSALAVVHGASPTTLEVIELKNLKTIASLSIEPGGSPAGISWSPDELLLACVEQHGVSVFDTTSWRRSHGISIPYPGSVRFSPQGLLGCGSWEKACILSVQDLKAYQVDEKAA